MIRYLIALLGAALFALAPAAAGAQTLSAGFNPPITASCGTVAVSTPCLDLSQTWNAGGVTFTGIKLNITDTASASGSLLIDLQKGGISQFAVDKVGTTTFGPASAATLYVSASATNVQMASGAVFGFSSGASANGTADVIFRRDAANTLALRNGTSAQTFNVYNSYTDSSNYERGIFSWSEVANQLTIGSAGAGTGGQRITNLVGSSVNLRTGASARWQVDATGNFVGQTAGTYVLTAPTVVASLTSCAAGLKGARSFVTDANSTTFLAVAAGGGANNVPVVCDGTSWKIG